MTIRNCSLVALCCAVVLTGIVASAQTSKPRPVAPVRQTAYIKASNPHMEDHFGDGGPLEGHAVALSGDGRTMAVGATSESSASKGINGKQADTSLYGAGAVYVFTRVGTQWVQQAYIKASNPGQGDKFGNMVSLSHDGNTLAVGADFEASATKGINGNQDDDSIPQAGAVYVFSRAGATWRQQAYIKASNTGEAGIGDQLGDGDQFGFAVHLSADGNTLAVGAIGEDSGAKGMNGNQNDNAQAGAGAVYIYTRAGATWTQQTYMKASNASAGDLFGYAVSLSSDGNILAVSAYDEASGSREINGVMDRGRRGSGAIYVFHRSGADWKQTAFLKSSNAEGGDSLGYDVAMSLDGTTIAAGAADEDCLTPGINPTGCDNDVRTDASTGAVYVFANEGGTWKQQAFLKASNPGEHYWFGARLALNGDGNTLAVGSQVENGGSRGINGPQNDAAEDTGAVYLFKRNGGTWSQAAYVKASNAEAYDEFGAGIALSRDGKIMAIGARNEAGGAKGVNANQKDNSAPGAGAVYVFAVQ
jgi:trimeric autotransporter adhesin